MPAAAMAQNVNRSQPPFDERRPPLRTMSSFANPANTPSTTPQTPYLKLGGEAALHRLTRRFYELMDELPEAWSIRQMHPVSLAGSQQSLFEFLSGWLGGPQLFVSHRGPPRLRMRHAPYAISPNARDEWLLCMRMALAEQVPDDGFRQALVMAFEQMAQHLINDAGCHDLAHASTGGVTATAT